MSMTIPNEMTVRMETKPRLHRMLEVQVNARWKPRIGRCDYANE